MMTFDQGGLNSKRGPRGEGGGGAEGAWTSFLLNSLCFHLFNITKETFIFLILPSSITTNREETL
jgi:hypothetical protein